MIEHKFTRAIGQTSQAWGEIRMRHGAAQPTVGVIVLAGHAAGISGESPLVNRPIKAMSVLALTGEKSNLQGMKETLFRLTTGIASVYHLLLGTALLVLPAAAMNGMMNVFLGVGVEFDAKLSMIGKFVSAYILAFGVMLALLCLKPVKLRVLVIPALVLFGIRLVNKLVFLTTIEESFGVARGRSIFALACLAVIFAVMTWARPTSDETKST
jgi:hypothetical protein